MNCAISENALSLELDYESYIEKTASGSLIRKKDKATGEYTSSYNQGLIWLPKEWVGCCAACILLEQPDCEDSTSMPPGLLILSDTEIHNHYGIIIQKTKKHIHMHNGKEYPTAQVRLPKGWVGKKVGMYRMQQS